MEQPIDENNSDIEVQFIDNQAVIYIIKDETVQGNASKLLTGTPKHHKDNSPKSAALIKSKKTKRISDKNSYDKEHSDNESNTILKPKALFEDGDVPGERMFSFNSKQRKISTSQLSTPKTPTSKKNNSKIVKITQHTKSHQDDHEVLPDDISENESKTPSKKLTRASYKSATPNAKNELSNYDSKFVYGTPTKSIHINFSECKPNINLTPKTPRSKKYVSNEDIETKTPKTVRKRLAKGIAIQKSESLYELNDSDYSISDKSGESDCESNDLNDKVVQPQVSVSKDVSLRRSCRKKEVSYVYKSEEYFLSKSTKSIKKSKTSDNTLKLLKNSALDKDQVDKLSENSNTKHNKKLKAIYNEIISKFPYWLCLLKEGFNLLLYGFGSKRQIINDFRMSMLEDKSVLVINGFFPGLTLKEILESLTIDLLDLDSCPGSAELVIQQIEETQKLKNAEHIYILIHNLDGVELQNYKAQHVLSRICSLNNVHLIASIDRVNAALMCDNTKLGDYNFIWMDCTNYSPYTVETDFVQSVMVKNIGTQHSLSGLNNVFKSLTSNAKRILLLLIKDRISNKNDKKYGGVPFSILYRWCRQQFLVSTDLALRSQLTEFVDHELVKWKRDADVLYVPVDVDVLIQFYKQNEEDDE